MTRIVCTADLHENLIDIPECDVLLIAGDVSFAFKGDLTAKQSFLAGEFREWLERIPATEVVLVAANHDQSIQAWGMPDGLRCHCATEIINASLVNNAYELVNPVVESTL